MQKPFTHHEENSMKTKLLLVSALLAAALPMLAVSGSKSHGLVLGIKNMYPVSGAFVQELNTTEPNMRGIPGDSKAWKINKAIKGQLFSTGRLVIQVRGLVPGDDTPNSESEFRAAVSCLTVGNDPNDPQTQIVETANALTSGFPTGPDGNAVIRAKLNLPSPCVAPVVMILNGAGSAWLAVTGFEPVGGK
jgi:hypothetical protein